MALSVKEIERAKSRTANYSLQDSEGLSLEITPKGKKHWRFRYQLNGKRNRVSLGSYPHVGLKEARLKRNELVRLIAEGVDPMERKKKEQAAIDEDATFEGIAREWFAKHVADWAPRHSLMVITRLEKNIFPYLGHKVLCEIQALELLHVLRIVEKRGAIEVARRTRGICSQIFRYAIILGKATRDPAADIQGAFQATRAVRHHPSITKPSAVGELMRAMWSFSGSFVVGQAIRLAPYVFVRPGELRTAAWEDIDLKLSRWEIPAQKMKSRQRLIIPLSRQAVTILSNMRNLTGYGYYVFPSIRTASRPMSENTINATLRRLGYSSDEMTGHGFRSMASTLLNEHGWNRDAIERQLAHIEKNSVRAAYNHADYLPERKKMMQWWADYLDSLRDKTSPPCAELYKEAKV